ncbi:MAG: UDP-galactopyranose mutase [Patescibacteria group bacterium]|nr:UDP-galactopyranose mutase [Patescibacteria group bacterium]
MLEEFDCVIIGAGISGSTIAERIANELRQPVLIIEKRNHIGGNCFDFYDKAGVLVPLYGPHFFHTNSDTVFRYVSNFIKWRKYEHRVKALVKGRLVPVPVNINTVNILFRLSIKNEKEMRSWLEKEQVKINNPKNSEEVALSRVGKRLYEMIFKNYTKKQWEKDPKDLGPEVLARIPVRDNFDDRYFTDKYQVMPDPSYTQIFKNMLKSRRIKVLLNTDYFKVKSELNPKAKIFFTGPIDQFFQYSEGKALEYRSLKFEYQNLNLDYFQMSAVINYPEPEFPWTRITEPKHATGQKIATTTIIYEYPSSSGEPYYPVPNERNLCLYKKYQSLAEKLEKKGIYFIGRLANYKYFNMDQAFENALNFFDRIKKEL